MPRSRRFGIVKFSPVVALIWLLSVAPPPQADHTALSLLAQERPPPLAIVDDSAPHREPKPKRRIRVAAARVRLADDALLACIRSHEQGRDGYATDTGNGYKGAYQFTDSSWEANFGDRSPAEVSPEEQDALARNYIARRGLSPWPTPNRACR